MAAFDQTLAIAIATALTPCGTTGAPGASLTALATGGMYLKLTSTASTAAASGTELTGTGYTTHGTQLAVSSSAPTGSPATATLPAVSAGVSWLNGSGGVWIINSVEITDSAFKRVWYGLFNGAPVSVAAGNTFMIAQNAITVQLS